MKIRRQYFAAATCLGWLFTTPVVAADLAASAAANVIEPLAISEIQVLEFGALSPTSEGGTVSVLNGNLRSVISGSVDLVGSGQKSATFLVSGDPFRSYSITPGPPVQLSNGSDTMSLTLVGSSSGTIGPDGTATFGYGGDLVVGPDQPTGTYTGTYLITINY